MRTRFRIPHRPWLTGDLSVKWITRKGRHTTLCLAVIAKDGTEISIELKDRDTYRLADSPVDTAEAFELERNQK